MCQLRDELASVGAAISGRLTGIVVKGLARDDDQIKYNGENDPDLRVEEGELTVRNIHANRMARK